MTKRLPRAKLPAEMTRAGMLKDGNVRITFVATEELKAQLQRLARAEHRSMGNFIAARLSEVVAKSPKSAPKAAKK